MLREATQGGVIDLPIVARSGELRANSYDASDDTIDLCWTTGARVRQMSWLEGAFDEELVVTPGAVRLGRLNGGAPLLNTHNGRALDGVIGSVVPGSAHIVNGSGMARVRLSTAPADADIVQKIREGIIRNVSVGYVRHKIEKIEKNGETPLWRIVDWEPFEISAVPVPADVGAQFRSASTLYPCSVAINSTSFAAAARTRMAAAAAGMAARAPEITTSLPPSQQREHMENNGLRDAIVARLARAAGERNVQIPEHARAYSEMTFVEMAATAIGWTGRAHTARDIEDVLKRAFHATSDFPGIFSDALNSRLLARYSVAKPVYRLVCAPYTATDFRAINVVRAGDFPMPQRILESGEIPTGTFGESKEQLTVFPYGVRFNISRQMIVNDNLGAIDQVLNSYGDTILRWENSIFTDLLISASHAGPSLLTDSTAMFATAHGNHVTSGTAIAIGSVGLGRSAMMKQKSIDGLALNIMPQILLCGPDRLTDAEQLVATINPALIASAQPDWIKRLTPAGDAGIDGNHWYLFADPSVLPCFVYGLLQGFEGPRLKAEDQFTSQGISVKLEHDFGVAGIDYRGGYHNAGAAPA